MKTPWQTLALPSEIPRSAALLTEVDLMRGLRAFRGFGWFALVGAALGLIAVVIMPETPLPGLMAFAILLIVLVSAGCLWRVRRDLALRREALLRGVVVEGSVTRHGQRFNLFSSRPHATICATFLLPEGQQSVSGILWRPEALRDLRRGSRLLGLWLAESRQIWLPLEIGLCLDAAPLELSEVVLDSSPQLPSELDEAE